MEHKGYNISYQSIIGTIAININYCVSWIIEGSRFLDNSL